MSKEAQAAFLQDYALMVGKTVAVVMSGVEDNFIIRFTDGTWITTPISDSNYGYWIQDAVTLGVMTQEEADARTKELEGGRT